MTRALALLALSYLVGAIPTSYLVGRLARGIDLREQGSRNLGATNLFRVMGWRYAVPVALFDMAKGAVPVLVFAQWGSPSPFFALACGIAAIVGHVFSVFVHFRGGKGVATATGVMLGLVPAAVGVTVIVWAVVVFATGYVSLGSILAAAVLPFAAWWLAPEGRPLIWLIGLVAGAIIWFHRANIRRLLAGTENRFGSRGRRAGPERPS